MHTQTGAKAPGGALGEVSRPGRRRSPWFDSRLVKFDWAGMELVRVSGPGGRCSPRSSNGWAHGDAVPGRMGQSRGARLLATLPPSRVIAHRPQSGAVTSTQLSLRHPARHRRRGRPSTNPPGNSRADTIDPFHVDSLDLNQALRRGWGSPARRSRDFSRCATRPLAPVSSSSRKPLRLQRGRTER